MLDLTLFRKPTFVGVSIAAFALSASMFAMFLYLTLYMQNVLGYSPLQAGLRFLPITLMSFICAALSGNLTERVPTRLLLGVGLGLVALGLLLMSGISAHSGWTPLLPGFLLAGAGVGLTNPAIASTAVGVVTRDAPAWRPGSTTRSGRSGSPPGSRGWARSSSRRSPPGSPIGWGVGVRLPPAEVLAQGNPRVIGPHPPLHDAFLTGWTGALNEILVIAAVVALAGAVSALALVRRTDFVAHGAPAAGAG